MKEEIALDPLNSSINTLEEILNEKHNDTGKGTSQNDLATG